MSSTMSSLFAPLKGPGEDMRKDNRREDSLVLIETHTNSLLYVFDKRWGRGCVFLTIIFEHISLNITGEMYNC